MGAPFLLPWNRPTPRHRRGGAVRRKFEPKAENSFSRNYIPGNGFHGYHHRCPGLKEVRSRREQRGWTGARARNRRFAKQTCFQARVARKPRVVSRRGMTNEALSRCESVRRDSVGAKCALFGTPKRGHPSPAPLLLLSKSNPLRWALIWLAVTAENALSFVFVRWFPTVL